MSAVAELAGVDVSIADWSELTELCELAEAIFLLIRSISS